MEANKIKFTEAALEQLERFKQEQARKLEESIVENKKFPGFDFIEITASDIQEESKKFIFSKANSKTDIKYIIVYCYFFIGISLMFFGIFYQDIIYIWHNQPKQLLYITMGFAITTLSGILTLYIRYSEKKKRNILKDYQDISTLESQYYNDLVKNVKAMNLKSIHDIEKSIHDIEQRHDDKIASGQKL